MKLIQLHIRVPEGDHCWRMDSSIEPCKYVESMGGHTTCRLADIVGYPMDVDEGAKKARACREAGEP